MSRHIALLFPSNIAPQAVRNLPPTVRKKITLQGDSHGEGVCMYAHTSTTAFVPSLAQAPRGLSAEEKRVKLLEIFHETVSIRRYCHFTTSHSGHTVERFLSGEWHLETRRISALLIDP